MVGCGGRGGFEMAIEFNLDGIGLGKVRGWVGDGAPSPGKEPSYVPLSHSLDFARRYEQHVGFLCIGSRC